MLGGLFHLYLGRPLLLAVVEEGSKQAAVEVVQHGDQEELVELKRCWKLEEGEGGEGGGELAGGGGIGGGRGGGEGRGGRRSRMSKRGEEKEEVEEDEEEEEV